MTHTFKKKFLKIIHLSSVIGGAQNRPVSTHGHLEFKCFHHFTRNISVQRIAEL